MATYAYVDGPLDGGTRNVGKGNRALRLSGAGAALPSNVRTRPEEGWYVRAADLTYRWATDRGTERLHRDIARPPAMPRVTTWTYVGGPLSGRRIGVERPEPWRTATGTPWLGRGDPTVRYYRADHTTKTYRAREAA